MSGWWMLSLTHSSSALVFLGFVFYHLLAAAAFFMSPGASSPSSSLLVAVVYFVVLSYYSLAVSGCLQLTPSPLTPLCRCCAFGGAYLSEPKYITKLLDKAKARQQEQEIIYERKLLKEREREDHLYGDKDKFVTTAYKQKLAEQAKWIEEERIRELREQANEVTNKKDLSDFYHNLLSKNVAFGASKHKVDRTAPQEKPAEAGRHSRDPDLDNSSEQEDGQVLEVQSDTEKASLGDNERGSLEPERTSLGAVKSEPDAAEASQNCLEKDSASEGQPISAKAERKPSQDALSAAKERFLARKRMRTK